MTTSLALEGKIPFYIYKDYEELSFYCTDGNRYQFHHEQNCCESVKIEDVNGDLDNLLYTPILKAEERVSTNEDIPSSDDDDIYRDESYTWTFYTFATKKGYVDVRWYGSSNGYYSESVYLDISPFDKVSIPQEVWDYCSIHYPELII